MSTAESNTVEWPVVQFEFFERSLNGGKNLPFHQVRRSAFEVLKSKGLPGPKDEEWRFTDISEITKSPLSFAYGTDSSGTGRETLPSNEILEGSLIPGLDAHKLFFIDGSFHSALSPDAADSKAVIRNLSEILSSKGPSDARDFIDGYLGRFAAFADYPFVALNTAFLQGGVAIHIPKNTVLEKPIHIVNISRNEADRALSMPRVLIVAESGSYGQIVESFYGAAGSLSLTCAVSEIVIRENAELHHTKIVTEGPRTYHIGHAAIHQDASSRYFSNLFTFGGGTVRNEVALRLAGEQIHSTVNGISILNGSQHVDNHTVVDHAIPHCQSNQQFKGIYGDKAKGIFNGTIIVREDAQKTNAIQSNQSLLLSDDAQVQTNPRLKIWANDVKCTHGATIGQLDDAALFYIRSRGIDKKTARDMLVYAFASEVLNQVSDPAVRAYIEREMQAKLSH